MWRLTLIWLVLFTVIAFARCSNRKSEIQTVANRIIIKFKPEVSVTVADSLAKNLGLTLVAEIPQIGARVYQVPATLQSEQMLKKCRQMPEIEYAEPDYPVKTMDRPMK